MFIVFFCNILAGTMAAVAGIEKLMAHFSKLPDYLGQSKDLTLVAENGRCVFVRWFAGAVHQKNPQLHPTYFFIISSTVPQIFC